MLGVPSLSSEISKSEQSVVKGVGKNRLTGLCDNEDVVASSEGILEVGGGSKVNIGIGSVGLTGGRTIKVPLLELSEGSDGTGESLIEAEK